MGPANAGFRGPPTRQGRQAQHRQAPNPAPHHPGPRRGGGGGPGQGPSGGNAPGPQGHRAGTPGPPPAKRARPKTPRGGATDTRAEPGGGSRPPGAERQGGAARPGGGRRGERRRPAPGIKKAPPQGGATTAVGTSTNCDRQARGARGRGPGEPPPGQPGRQAGTREGREGEPHSGEGRGREPPPHWPPLGLTQWGPGSRCLGVYLPSPGPVWASERDGIGDLRGFSPQGPGALLYLILGHYYVT